MEDLKLKITENLVITYKKLDNYKSGEHFYQVYEDKNTLDNLFELQINQNFAHICLLFPNDKVDTVLRHINVYDFFTYTLIPEKVDFEIYEKIYDFFFFSPLSVAYITWIGSLIFLPKISSDTVTVNNSLIKLGNCESCFLKERNCNKIVPFMNIFHPDKEFNLEELNLMCEILRNFSQKIYKDLTEYLVLEDLKAFSLARQSVGIERHYWLNPWKIY